MNRFAALTIAIGLVAAACGGGDDGALNTCDDVADASVDLVQELIDQFEAMTPSEAGDVLGGNLPPEMTALEEEGREIAARGEELGCTDLDALVREKAERLEADPANGFTQLIVEGTKDGDDVFGRLSR